MKGRVRLEKHYILKKVGVVLIAVASIVALICAVVSLGKSVNHVIELEQSGEVNASLQSEVQIEETPTEDEGPLNNILNMF